MSNARKTGWAGIALLALATMPLAGLSAEASPRSGWQQRHDGYRPALQYQAAPLAWRQARPYTRFDIEGIRLQQRQP